MEKEGVLQWLENVRAAALVAVSVQQCECVEQLMYTT